MSYNVTVVFGGEREYEFTLHDADVAPTTKEQARSWLATEFEELECTPSNPMGKVLVLDMVLNVAKYGGESRFEQQTEWSKKFALMTAAALDRPAVRGRRLFRGWLSVSTAVRHPAGALGLRAWWFGQPLIQPCAERG